MLEAFVVKCDKRYAESIHDNNLKSKSSRIWDIYLHSLLWITPGVA